MNAPVPRPFGSGHLTAALCCVAAHAAAVAWSAEADVADAFNRFCAEHFAAEREPEVYRAFGAELQLVPKSAWSHVSRRSACFAWQTNLPATSVVEYGTTTRYGQKADPPERPFSLHLHYLRGLKPRTTYHYRTVCTDERGKSLATKDKTFVTPALAEAIAVPGTLEGPPYVLDKPNATYLLTRDVESDGTCIFIAASGITLDLGGHTVTYDQTRDTASQGACGVRGHKQRGIGLAKVRVVNGIVRRGRGGSSTRKLYDTLYNPVFFSKPSGLDLAGLTVHYHGCQVIGIVWLIRGERNRLHHNVVRDASTELFDRHKGLDAIAFQTAHSACDHNLIARTRHRGIAVSSDNDIHANEIYVDSYATNSYGVMYYGRGGHDVAIHDNRIFGTGYHPIGIGSGQGYRDVTVRANYIQMQGVAPQGRWEGGVGGGDPKGQLETVNGIRLQRPQGNVEHADNVIVVKGRGARRWLRGLWLVPGEAAADNLVVRNNRVKVIAEDDRVNGYAVLAGGARGVEMPPVRLVGNTLISNVCNVQFGDQYSIGGRHAFQANRLVKVGADPRYRTIRLGWRGWKYETFGHTFTDTTFEGGAGYDSVSFDGTRRGRYDFAVRWTLEVRTLPGARVTVVAAPPGGGAGERAAGIAGDDGRFAAPLTHYVRTREGKTLRTPHTVTVEKDGRRATRKLTVDGRKSVAIQLP